MNIVMVIQNFYPSIGGAERQALTLARELVKKGVAVTLLTQRAPNTLLRETMDGVHVRRLGKGTFSFLVWSFAWVLFFGRRYDAIHAHIGSSHAVGAALAGWLLKKRTLVKLSGSNVVGEIPVSRRSVLGRLKLRAFGLLRPILILVNNAQRRDLHGFGLESLETHLIPNGVDTATFCPASGQRKQTLRAELAWDGVVFLFVGRFSPDKLRLDVFRNVLTAWSRLSEDAAHPSLYLVGAGILEDDYRTAIAELGLTGSVALWPASEKVCELYQAADVFVLPSVTEGLSNALLEAMACGLPVAGSRVSGIADLLTEDKQARLFDPLSPEEIQHSFGSLLHDAGARKNLGASALEFARQFSIENSVARHIALYRAA
jgi:glycosyltransferase involved in cell wall biosynthesis